MFCLVLHVVPLRVRLTDIALAKIQSSPQKYSPISRQMPFALHLHDLWTQNGKVHGWQRHNLDVFSICKMEHYVFVLYV